MVTKNRQSKFNLDTIIKISIAVAITASLTMNINFNNTVNNYQQQTEQKINQTIDKIDLLGNNTQLSDKQLLQVVKQILKEVK